MFFLADNPFIILALSLDIGGAVYNHWGKETCDAAGAQVLYKGIIVSSDHGKGGAASIVCFTGKPEEDDDTKLMTKHHRLIKNTFLKKGVAIYRGNLMPFTNLQCMRKDHANITDRKSFFVFARAA